MSNALREVLLATTTFRHSPLMGRMSALSAPPPQPSASATGVVPVNPAHALSRAQTAAPGHAMLYGEAA